MVSPPCSRAGRQAQVCRGRAETRRRGWAAEPSFPVTQVAPLEKGPGAAAGAFLLYWANGHVHGLAGGRG
jgi:hypothetical protein